MRGGRRPGFQTVGSGCARPPRVPRLQVQAPALQHPRVAQPARPWAFRRGAPRPPCRAESLWGWLCPENSFSGQGHCLLRFPAQGKATPGPLSLSAFLRTRKEAGSVDVKIEAPASQDRPGGGYPTSPSVGRPRHAWQGRVPTGPLPLSCTGTLGLWCTGRHTAGATRLPGGHCAEAAVWFP